jgi:hypothetical protein
LCYHCNKPAYICTKLKSSVKYIAACQDYFFDHYEQAIAMMDNDDFDGLYNEMWEKVKPVVDDPHADQNVYTDWINEAARTFFASKWSSQPPAVFRPYPWLGPAPSAMLLLLLSTTYILSPLVGSTSTECMLVLLQKQTRRVLKGGAEPPPSRPAPSGAAVGQGLDGGGAGLANSHISYIYICATAISYLILSLHIHSYGHNFGPDALTRKQCRARVVAALGRALGVGP